MQHQAMHGLYHANASIRGLLKSGLGRMGLLQKQPHPADHKVVILFVVGGISMAEVRCVQQAISAHQGGSTSVQQILIGGTVLARASDVYQNGF